MNPGMDIVLHRRTEHLIETYLSTPSNSLAIVGAPGSGKSYVSKYISARLLGLTGDKTSAHAYSQNINFAKVKSGIDEVREIQNFLKLTVPGKQAIKRVLKLENIDKLRFEAQNALLKTLEEPPLDTVIIITLTESENVLPTIHSRVQSIELQPISLQSAQNFFQFEGTPALIQKYYFMSGGNAGLLHALLADDESHPLTNAINRAREILNMNKYQRISAVDSMLKQKDLSAIELVDGLYRILQAGFKNAVVNKTNTEIKTFAARLNILDHSLNDLKSNVQPKIVLSRLMLEL